MSEPKYGTLDPSDLVSSLSPIIERLESLARPVDVSISVTDESVKTLADGLTAILKTSLATLTAVASSGECRREVPYSPLHPVIDSDGNFKWCCNHNPEHCGK